MDIEQLWFTCLVEDYEDNFTDKAKKTPHLTQNLQKNAISMNTRNP